ncbi:MAG TPA: hypothetical protein ENH85_12335 [Candidatus Scalindua sp.]|nr:hypothetical protein [Candidatus Scalindua sp.]HDZ15726.1 hypothetical protein [Pricia sp.]
MNISKDTYGIHFEAFGFKLSLMPKETSGWSGRKKSFRIRFLNSKAEFPKSYWISIGKRIKNGT